MKNINNLLVIIILLFFATTKTFGDNRYWIASNTANWNDTANWSTSSGGLGGASVPSPTNVAMFDVNGLGNCNIDIAISIGGLNINGYTGIVDLSGYNLTVAGSTSDMTFSSGTLNDTSNTGLVSLTSSAATFFSGTTFGTQLTVNSGRLHLDGSTFNNTASLTKIGGNNDDGLGGCTFNGITTITNSGSGDINLGRTNPDVFNNDITFISAGEEIHVAMIAAGTQFNGNVYVESSSNNIEFGTNGGTSTLASGKVIAVTGGGFTSGNLEFTNFTQLGGTPQTIAMGGTGTRLYFRSGSVWNGNMTASGPRIFLNGGTFNGTNAITKTGGNGDGGTGGCIFNGVTTIANSGSADLNLAVTNPDVFNNDVTFSCPGHEIHVANTAAGTQFNGNVIVESSNGNIEFGMNGGTSTLAAGKTVSIGGGGFTNGYLQFQNFVQLGTTPQSLSTGGTFSRLYFNSGSIWNGDLTVVGPRIYVNGSTFNGAASFTKNGSTADGSSGGNTFNGITYFENSGGNFWSLADTNPDVFNREVTFYANSGRFNVANIAVGTQFNDNVILESSNDHIFFGSNGGSSTLAAGKTITIGATNGFTTGELRFDNFTQLGSTSQTLTLTGTARLYFNPGSTWNGDLTVNTPRIHLNGSTFNGNTTITKNSSGYDSGIGGNVFNGTTTINITIHSANNIVMANTNPDIFNGDVTFNGTGRIYVADLATGNEINGNLTVNSPDNRVYFGNSLGTIIMKGTAPQSINKVGATPDPSFYQLEIDNASDDVTLNTPINVRNLLVLNQGNIVTSATNILTLNDDVIVANASNNSYVQGSVNKIGDDAFSFPTGDNGFYQPITISAPANTTDAYTAQYFNEDSNGIYNHTSKDPSIDNITHLEYWTLERTSGTSNVNVALAWQLASSVYGNINDLIVASWDGTQWKDSGNGGTSGDLTNGTIDSSTPLANYISFTIASNDPSTFFAPTLSINEFTTNTIKFFPNPVTNRLNIIWNNFNSKNFKIFNIIGQDFTSSLSILEQNSSGIIFDCSQLNTGTYIIKMDNTAKKFIKY